jgi:hypothetical protein
LAAASTREADKEAAVPYGFLDIVATPSVKAAHALHTGLLW